MNGTVHIEVSRWKSSIEEEIHRECQETKNFMLDELKHYILMCEGLRQTGDEDPFFVYGAKWANCVRGYLENHFDTVMGYLRSGKFNSAKEQERWLQLTATLIQNFNIEWMARRKKIPKLAGSALIHSYSLGEGHPAFAETIMAMEALNQWLHDEMSVLFSPFQGIPPLLAVSASEQYAFQIYPSIPAYDAPQKERKLQIEQFLIMSWINLPRWTPIHIRYCPAIAHEHFHRVAHLIRTAHIERERKRNSALANEETIRLEMVGYYGSELVTLLDLFDYLSESLYNKITELQKDTIEQLKKSLGVYFVANNAIIVDYMISNSADICAEELLADACGLVLLGPSSLWAFLNKLRIWHTLSFLDDLKIPGVHVTHPPVALRVQLMLGLLRACGFRQIAEGIDQAVKNLRNKCPQIDPRGNHTFQELSGWLDDELPKFTSACIRLSNAIKGSCWAKISVNGEEMWIEKMADIWNRLKKGQVYLPDSIGVDDIINALWWKELYVGRNEMSGHLAWRLALSHKLRNIPRGEIL